MRLVAEDMEKLAQAENMVENDSNSENQTTLTEEEREAIREEERRQYALRSEAKKKKFKTTLIVKWVLAVLSLAGVITFIAIYFSQQQ